MKLITALQVLCMMLSEPDATACMPGETPIDTGSISTPLAAKKPFLAATTPGHTVAVGETWPKDTLVADHAGAAPSATACSASSAGHTSFIPKCIRGLSLRCRIRAAVVAPAVIPRMPQCAALSLRGVYVSGPCMLKPRSWSSAIAAIGPERSSWPRQRSASCCNGISCEAFPLRPPCRLCLPEGLIGLTPRAKRPSFTVP